VCWVPVALQEIQCTYTYIDIIVIYIYIYIYIYEWIELHLTPRLFSCRRCREPGVPMFAATSEYSRFALLPMGTLENTKHKGWTWIMAMPLAEVQKAGVDFDPNNRTVKAIQGDAASGSALDVLTDGSLHIVTSSLSF